MTDTYVITDVPITDEGIFDTDEAFLVNRKFSLTPIRPKCLCVVRFSGDVQVTSQGIRKENADIVAIFLPSKNQRVSTSLKHFQYMLIIASSWLLGFVFAAMPQCTPYVLWTMLGSYFTLVIRRVRYCWVNKKSPDVDIETSSYLAPVPPYKIIQAANPSVPIYFSLKEMWEAYPITQIDWFNLEAMGLPTQNNMTPEFFWSLPVV